MQSLKIERGWIAWVIGGLEVLLAMSLAVWLLTVPGLFRVYYPALRNSAQSPDATAIVRWLSSNYRERSLNLVLTSGQLNSRELQHYSDVRRLFQWFPWLTTGLALLTGLVLLLAKPTRTLLARAQVRGLIVWLVFLLLIGGLAWWDWKTFFAWVHHPFFGDRSWRLSKDAYSLQLFPTSFWRATAAAVLLAPGLLLASAAAFDHLGKRMPEDRARAPGERE